MEPVLCLELAEFYLQIFDKNPGTTDPKMKGSLSSDSQIARKFYQEVCEKLGKICKTSELSSSSMEPNSNQMDKTKGVTYFDCLFF